MSRMLGGYPGLVSGGISHRAALKEEDEDENVHDLSDDIDVETDLEPPRLVKYKETSYELYGETTFRPSASFWFLGIQVYVVSLTLTCY